MAQASFLSLFNTTMNIGGDYRFKIYSYDSSYLHKVVIKCGSYSMTFNRVKGGVETSYTVPLTWANAMPNSTSLNGSITLTTYQSNYSTKVGANDVQTTKFNITNVSNFTPSVSISVEDTEEDIPTKFQDFVQAKSKINVTLNASAKYGATIKSYKTTLNGVTYSGQSFTTNALTFNGTYHLATTITDSRGRTATNSRTVHILPYAHPKITSFSTSREGNHILANVNFSISEVDGLNDCNYSLEYKLKDSDSWSILASGSVYSLNDTIKSGEILNADSSYDTRLIISDYFKEVIALSSVGTSFELIHFNKNGKALGFGKISEKEEGVEFGIPAFFDRPVIIGNEDKILWSGENLMIETERAELTELITDQQNGIVLVFSRYTNGNGEDVNFTSFFISKVFIDKKRGYGNSFVMTASKFGAIATKYLYINDTYITGNTDNDATGTSNGITYNNGVFCLRYVIGV